MADLNNPEASIRNTGKSISPSEMALIIGGLTMFLVLLYAMWDILNPISLAIGLGILVWPLRAYRAVRALLLAGGFLLMLWLLSELGSVLIPFILAYLLAYLFNPIVDLLFDRFRVPRWASSLLVTLLIVGIVVLFLLLLVPSIVGELGTLAQRILGGVNELRTWLLNSSFLDTLAANGIIDSKDDVAAQLTTLIQDRTADFASQIPVWAQGLVASIGSLLGAITVAALIPILMFYTLKDYPDIKARLVDLFPTFGGQREYLVTAGGIVGDYLRGQLTISAIAAFLVAIPLALFNVPFALLIGVMAGVLNLIPTFGIVITYTVGITLAALFGDPWLLKVITVVGVLLFESFLEQTVLTPNIMGQKMGLHPVLILLALFIFGYFLGIFGLLIAVPATALLVTAYDASRSDMTLELSAYTTTPTVMWGQNRG